MHINVIHGDALEADADVLVLKYAQQFYGADRAAATRLDAVVDDLSRRMPGSKDVLYLKSRGVLGADNVLFVGVPPLALFRYKEIREFGRRALVALAAANEDIRKIAMTIHGPGYGLDEAEAFTAQLAGIFDALDAGEGPRSLEQVSFYELDAGIEQRLQGVLASIVPTGELSQPSASTGATTLAPASVAAIRSVGAESEKKRHIFVAMPFAKEFEDHYHYGIRGAARETGFLCERADLSVFTGDVMTWVKERISTADLVVADLSTANPNVYLEVGYAWGCGRRTVLIARSKDDLKFDVQGQRCLFYENIKELEGLLTEELRGL